MSTPVYKKEGKAHLIFSNGLWAVLWPELTTPQNLHDVMNTWDWVVRKNSSLYAQRQ